MNPLYSAFASVVGDVEVVEIIQSAQKEISNSGPWLGTISSISTSPRTLRLRRLGRVLASGTRCWSVGARIVLGVARGGS